MERINEIKEIISSSAELVEFSEYGDGVSEEWIQKAESRLGFSLPESYKWWLRQYSGGEIHGEEIYSIFEIDFDNILEGDIVYMHEFYQKNKKYKRNVLVVSETDEDMFYFNLQKKNAEDDFPVYAWSTKQPYAKDFIEFLKKRITKSEQNRN